MKDHIYNELSEAISMRQRSNESDKEYWQRVSSQLLGVILELGMLPPESEFEFKRDFGGGLEVKFFKKERKWED